jgi:chemotaxis protein CheZ
MSFARQGAATAVKSASRPTNKSMVVGVSAVRPCCLGASSFASAAAELNAVRNETAAATNAILDATERIRATAATLPHKHRSVLTAEVIRILEACTFEDLTGQRIAKAVCLIEQAQSGISGRKKGLEAAGAARRTGDAGLLNGPQLPSAAWTQADIDAMFNGKARKQGGASRKKASR